MSAVEFDTDRYWSVTADDHVVFAVPNPPWGVGGKIGNALGAPDRVAVTVRAVPANEEARRRQDAATQMLYFALNDWAAYGWEKMGDWSQQDYEDILKVAESLLPSRPSDWPETYEFFAARANV